MGDIRRCITFLIAILMLSASAVFGQLSDLKGEWESISPYTRGITRVIITSDPNGDSIEAWGKCHPRDCGWGKTLLSRVGKSVDDHSFNRGYAIWEPGFASKYMLLTIDRRMLRIETVTIFRDRSRRSSYRSVEYFRRVDGDELH